jgi:tetratricopeptide (TPR) repeat protein
MRAGWFADQMRGRTEAVRKGFVEDHVARAAAIRADSEETCAAEAQLALGADANNEAAKKLFAECSKPKAVAAARPPPQAQRAASPRKLEAPVQIEREAEAEPEPEPEPPAPRAARPPSRGEANTQARALAAEGNQKLLAKDFDGAIALFQQALDLKPADAVVARLYRSLGIALTEQGNLEEGAHYYRLYLPLCTDAKERDYLRRTLEEYEARRRQ